MAKTNRKAAGTSLSKRRWEKLARNKLALVGAIMALSVIILCILAPLLTPDDPSYIDMALRYAAPSKEHIFGCDQSGRDVLARLLYGGRLSILIGIVSALFASLLGAVIGSISAYVGGTTDQVLLYISEIFSAFPSTMLILIIMGFAGQGVGIMLMVFIFTGWVSSMRLVRSRILSLKQEAFVESCRATGIRATSIMFRHLLPNTMGVVIINCTSNIAGYVLSEAGLSFLGLGVPKGTPTWGNMLNAARKLNTMQNYPLLWLLPGIAISIFVLGVSFFGDGLRDVFDVTQE